MKSNGKTKTLMVHNFSFFKEEEFLTKMLQKFQRTISEHQQEAIHAIDNYKKGGDPFLNFGEVKFHVTTNQCCVNVMSGNRESVLVGSVAEKNCCLYSVSGEDLNFQLMNPATKAEANWRSYVTEAANNSNNPLYLASAIGNIMCIASVNNVIHDFFQGSSDVVVEDKEFAGVGGIESINTKVLTRLAGVFRGSKTSKGFKVPKRQEQMFTVISKSVLTTLNKLASEIKIKDFPQEHVYTGVYDSFLVRLFGQISQEFLDCSLVSLVFNVYTPQEAHENLLCYGSSTSTIIPFEQLPEYIDPSTLDPKVQVIMPEGVEAKGGKVS